MFDENYEQGVYNRQTVVEGSPCSDDNDEHFAALARDLHRCAEILKGAAAIKRDSLMTDAAIISALNLVWGELISGYEIIHERDADKKQTFSQRQAQPKLTEEELVKQTIFDISRAIRCDALQIMPLLLVSFLAVSYANKLFKALDLKMPQKLAASLCWPDEPPFRRTPNPDEIAGNVRLILSKELQRAGTGNS